MHLDIIYRSPVYTESLYIRAANSCCVSVGGSNLCTVFDCIVHVYGTVADLCSLAFEPRDCMVWQ